MSVFTIVIPTMWKVKSFQLMIEDLIEQPLVDEIIIINNSISQEPLWPALNDNKITMIRMADNIGVNPAWNLGVSQARNQNVCILNDDVNVDLRVFSRISPFMDDVDFGVAGIHPGEMQFNQMPFVDGAIDVVPWTEPVEKHAYHFGFGTMFFVRCDNWFTIPDGLKIYYGDDWVFETNRIYGRHIYLISNLFYHSDAAQTCTAVWSKEERDRMLVDEGMAYNSSIYQFRTQRYNEFLHQEYQAACDATTDINQHLPIILHYANQCQSVVEFGVRDGMSSRAFLVSDAALTSYDLNDHMYVRHLFSTAKQIGKNVEFVVANSLNVSIKPCDMIFFDTDHTYDQLTRELELHGNKARKYLMFHDTVTYGLQLCPAIDEFIAKNPQWKIVAQFFNNNGLTVVGRVDL